MDWNVFNHSSLAAIVILSVSLLCYAQDDHYDDYTCVDYGDYTSVQAPDFDAMTAATRVLLGPKYTDYTATETAEFFQRTKTCTDANGCNFGCLAIAACYSSILQCYSNKGCNFKCDGNLACSNMIFEAANTSQQIHIECYAESCQDMEIFISDVQSAHIHCKEEDACASMTVHFAKSADTSVTCYKHDACRDLKVITYDDAHTILHMYAYSSGIIFRNQNGFNQDIITCDLHSKFVEYSYGANNIQSLIRAEYGSSTARLPCEDIVVQCSENDVTTVGSYQSCVMAYTIKPVAIFDALPGQSGCKFEGSTCVNIALYDIAGLQCQGGCSSTH